MKISNINNQYSSKTFSGKRNPNFTGANPSKLSEKAASKISGLIEKAAGTDIFRKSAKALSRFDSFKLLLIAESFYLSSWYLIWNLKDKKLDKEQKPQMFVHDVITLGLSTAGALYADDRVTSLVNKGAEKHFAKHADFYKNLGKKTAEADKNPPLKNLIDKAVQTAGETGGRLKQGLEETAELMHSGLKNIIGKEGKLKTFQITKEEFTNVQNGITNAVKEAAGKPESAAILKQTITGLAGKLYELSAARGEAENTMKGIDKLKGIVIFGFMYRFAGSVLASPLAIKLCDKFMPKKQHK